MAQQTTARLRILRLLAGTIASLTASSQEAAIAQPSAARVPIALVRMTTSDGRDVQVTVNAMRWSHDLDFRARDALTPTNAAVPLALSPFIYASIPFEDVAQIDVHGMQVTLNNGMVLHGANYGHLQTDSGEFDIRSLQRLSRLAVGSGPAAPAINLEGQPSQLWRLHGACVGRPLAIRRPAFAFFYPGVLSDTQPRAYRVVANAPFHLTRYHETSGANRIEDFARIEITRSRQSSNVGTFAVATQIDGAVRLGRILHRNGYPELAENAPFNWADHWVLTGVLEGALGTRIVVLNECVDRQHTMTIEREESVGVAFERPTAPVQRLAVEISFPSTGGTVWETTDIRGHVSDSFAQVWVVICPNAARPQCWVQARAEVQPDGQWFVNGAHFGERANLGERFAVRAFANPATPLREGQILTDWPAAQVRSAVSGGLVRR